MTSQDRSEHFQILLDNTAEVHYVCDSIYVTEVVNGWQIKRHSNFIRNEKMIDACNRIWCYNPTSSGTKHAYGYANSKNKPVWVIEKQVS